MKLKEAVKVAQWINVDKQEFAIAYIAADPDGEMWGYSCEPYIEGYEGGWRYEEGSPVYVLGWYDGDKHWSNTCRKV